MGPIRYPPTTITMECSTRMSAPRFYIAYGGYQDDVYTCPEQLAPPRVHSPSPRPLIHPSARDLLPDQAIRQSY